MLNRYSGGSMKDQLLQCRAYLGDLRKYYKALESYKKNFESSFSKYLFPFTGKGLINDKTGGKIAVPQKFWKTFPSVIDLIRIGADLSFIEEDLEISIKGIKISTSALDMSAAVTIKEMFVEDEYQIENLDLNNKLVLDIGANIGDSSVSFAMKGASVHAFEPLPMLQKYLVKNSIQNKMDGNIWVHPVGLSDKNERVEIWAKTYGTACASSIYHAAKNTARNPNMNRQELELVKGTSNYQISVNFM
jgi:FkbM family methyltransferase